MNWLTNIKKCSPSTGSDRSLKITSSWSTKILPKSEKKNIYSTFSCNFINISFFYVLKTRIALLILNINRKEDKSFRIFFLYMKLKFFILSTKHMWHIILNFLFKNSWFFLISFFFFSLDIYKNSTGAVLKVLFFHYLSQTRIKDESCDKHVTASVKYYHMTWAKKWNPKHLE